MRREREITSGFDDLCLKSNTSRIDYYIDIITISIRLGGGKQAERRERKRKKKTLDRICSTQEKPLVILTYEILIVTDEIGSVQNESRHENWMKDVSMVS